MPNVALAKLLQEHELFYVGTSQMEKDIITPLVDEGKIRAFYTVNAHKLARKFTFKNLLLPFLVIRDVRECKKVLRKIRPDVVFSKGGYVGLPVVIAAKKLGIKTVVHESDVSVGLANRISFAFADKKLSAFPLKNATQVGAILRKNDGNKQKGLKTMGFDGKKPVLLVIGGSLGAGALNNAVCRYANVLSQTFDVFVITGRGKKIDCNLVHQAEFIANVWDVYSASSVAVTRAGANTLCELATAKLPFVAVPLVKSSRGEQKLNATYFENQNVGVTLDEQNLHELARAVTKVYQNRAFYIKNAAKLNVDGTKTVADILTDGK